MSDTRETSKGGFHFGNVGGGVNVEAGGDVVAGDKTTTTTTTIKNGFAGDEQNSIDRDKKDQVISDIQQQVNALKQVKEETADVPTGKPAPAEIATKVVGALDRAGGIVDKLQGLATKTGDVAETVGKFAVKYGPLILSARHLFGLP